MELALPRDQGLFGITKVLPEQVLGELNDLAPQVLIQAGARANALESSGIHTEPSLQLADQEGHLDGLRARIGVDLS